MGTCSSCACDPGHTIPIRKLHPFCVPDFNIIYRSFILELARSLVSIPYSLAPFQCRVDESCRITIRFASAKLDGINRDDSLYWIEPLLSSDKSNLKSHDNVRRIDVISHFYRFEYRAHASLFIASYLTNKRNYISHPPRKRFCDEICTYLRTSIIYLHMIKDYTSN